MTRRVVIFIDEKHNQYITPEFNGDKAELKAIGSMDHCDKNWDEIEALFRKCETLEEFESVNAIAQNFYHSFFDFDKNPNAGPVTIAPPIEKIMTDQIIFVYVDDIDVTTKINKKDGFNNMQTKENTNPKKRLYIDMDGTLAIWKNVTYLEELCEEGYFRDLPSQQSVVDAVKIIINERPDIEVFILSAFLQESAYAISEKHEWLNAFLPEIDESHRIFCPCGVKKSRHLLEYYRKPLKNMTNEEVNDYYKHPVKGDVLLDDYSRNLHEWNDDGGFGIKLLNGINGTYGTWKGAAVSKFWTPREIASTILAYIDML